MTAPVRFAAPAVVEYIRCGYAFCGADGQDCCGGVAVPVRFAAPAVVPDDPAGDALGVLVGAFGPVDILGGMPFVAPAVVEPERSAAILAGMPHVAAALGVEVSPAVVTPVVLQPVTVEDVADAGTIAAAVDLLAAEVAEVGTVMGPGPVTDDKLTQWLGVPVVVDDRLPANAPLMLVGPGVDPGDPPQAVAVEAPAPAPAADPAPVGRVEVDTRPTPATIAKGMQFAAPADPRGMPKLAAAIRDELVRAVREYCANDPRTLQTDIGPSEIGHECDSYVIRRALGFPGVTQPDPWASFVGTAVHAKLADVFDACNRALGIEHYLIERKVYVTDGIYGSCDLFRGGIVIDHKIVGVDSMKAIKKGWEEIPKYHKQVNEYGVGWKRAGYEVTHVAIAAWPRSGFLDGLHVLVDDFRPELAEQALDRLSGLVQLAVEKNLDESDEHWPDVPTAPGKGCGFCVYYDPIMSHQGRVGAGLLPVPDKTACPMGREYQSDRSRGTGRGKGRVTP